MLLNRVLWQLLKNMLSYVVYLLFIAEKVYNFFLYVSEHVPYLYTYSSNVVLFKH